MFCLFLINCGTPQHVPATLYHITENRFRGSGRELASGKPSWQGFGERHWCAFRFLLSWKPSSDFNYSVKFFLVFLRSWMYFKDEKVNSVLPGLITRNSSGFQQPLLRVESIPAFSTSSLLIPLLFWLYSTFSKSSFLSLPFSSIKCCCVSQAL